MAAPRSSTSANGRHASPAVDASPVKGTAAGAAGAEGGRRGDRIGGREGVTIRWEPDRIIPSADQARRRRERRSTKPRAPATRATTLPRLAGSISGTPGVGLELVKSSWPVDSLKVIV